MDNVNLSDGSWDTCSKNPKHKNFVSVLKFDKKKLPQKYQTEDVLDYIQTVSQLTVKLTVRTEPQDSSPTEPTFGSGWIANVEKVKTRKSERSSQYQTTYRIWVKTALHVIFDDNENFKKKSIAVDLFYNDRQELGEVKRLCKTLYTPWKPPKHNDDGRIYCDTFDAELYTRLENIVSRLRLKEFNPIRHFPFNDVAVVVSHPHGEQKYITVGHQVDLKWKEEWTKCNVRYDAPTCPGSSGGPVILIEATKRGFNLIAHRGVYIPEDGPSNFSVEAPISSRKRKGSDSQLTTIKLEKR